MTPVEARLAEIVEPVLRRANDKSRLRIEVGPGCQWRMYLAPPVPMTDEPTVVLPVFETNEDMAAWTHQQGGLR